jgi:Fur family transcriptional regulator, iron response regulator
MKRDLSEVLREHGIQPSVQRMAVAEYVLATSAHPSADHVWAEVQKTMPVLSRATVYNTLNLFVDKGLLRRQVLGEGRVVFDPKTEPHHHFIDEATGEIHDVPWSAIKVSRLAELPGFDVRDYQVVMHGRRKRRP